MKFLLSQTIAFLLLTARLGLAGIENSPVRLWILPFENSQAIRSLDHLEEALPALLAVAVTEVDQTVIVDRRHLHRILAEQSLNLEGLTSPGDRYRVGRLLGATVIISGSFAQQGQSLLITMRAFDVESGVVTSAVQGTGPAHRLAILVSRLYQELARDLGRALPTLHRDQIDQAPVSNLHFMRGLAHYHSARYNQALAEFMQSAEEKALSNISRWWRALTYLAQQQYDHAYLELSRLQADATPLSHKDIEAKIRSCENHLSSKDIELIRQLANLAATKE